MKSFTPIKKFKRNSFSKSRIQKLNHNKKKASCYVLITCGEPNAEEKMDVEMTYEGEPILAAYLLENAQSILDDKICNS
ncbi:MAG TPA: hypothetical protein VLG76_06750 [Rhabdochlamydiaceae bacterium]|nr:hypothetical protein [Rhabdochlamydiaceae bacterium]